MIMTDKVKETMDQQQGHFLNKFATMLGSARLGVCQADGEVPQIEAGSPRRGRRVKGGKTQNIGLFIKTSMLGIQGSNAPAGTVQYRQLRLRVVKSFAGKGEYRHGEPTKGTGATRESGPIEEH
jgi:hypothetical protein